MITQVEWQVSTRKRVPMRSVLSAETGRWHLFEITGVSSIVYVPTDQSINQSINHTRHTIAPSYAPYAPITVNTLARTHDRYESIARCVRARHLCAWGYIRRCEVLTDRGILLVENFLSIPKSRVRRRPRDLISVAATFEAAFFTSNRETRIRESARARPSTRLDACARTMNGMMNACE